MHKYKYLMQNTILLTISQFGSKFLAVILVPLYTSVLSTEDYGIADIVTTSVTLLIYICTFYIGSAVLRFSLEKPKHAKYTLKIALKILSYGSLVVLLGLFVLWQSNLLEVSNYVFIFVLGLFIAEGLEGILYQYLRGIDKVKVMAICSFASTLFRLFATLITLLALKWGVFGYLFSMVVGPLLASLIGLFFCRDVETEPLSESDVKCLQKEMIAFSIPTAISQLGWWINNSIDRYIVVWLKGAALNGIYSMAYKIPSIMSMICNIFCQAWGISAIKEFDEQDKDGFYANVYSAFNAGLSIVCVLIILFNVPISIILFKNDFITAWRYSSFLVLAMEFSGLASFLSGIFGAVKKNSILAYSTAVAAIINILLNIILIPKLGGSGAAIATGISFYACFMVRLVLSRKYIRFKHNFVADHIVYLLIIVQIFMEHTQNHCYWGQILVVMIILGIYRQYLAVYISKVHSILKKYKVVK